MRFLLALLLIAPAFAQPQPINGWLSRLQPIVGKLVRVQMTWGEEREGRITGVTADQLTLRFRSGEASLSKTDVHQVRLVLGATRPERAKFGAGIGAGLGVALGFAETPSASNAGLRTAVVAESAVYLGLIGLAVGVATPTHYRTIYVR